MTKKQNADGVRARFAAVRMFLAGALTGAPLDQRPWDEPGEEPRMPFRADPHPTRLQQLDLALCALIWWRAFRREYFLDPRVAYPGAAIVAAGFAGAAALFALTGALFA